MTFNSEASSSSPFPEYADPKYLSKLVAHQRPPGLQDMASLPPMPGEVWWSTDSRALMMKGSSWDHVSSLQPDHSDQKAVRRNAQHFTIRHRIATSVDAVGVPSWGVPHILVLQEKKHYAGPTALLCKHCLAEDLSTRGYAYWRTMHQLPGINWCTEHGVRLFAFRVVNVHLLKLTRRLLDALPPPQPAADLMKSATLARYKDALRRAPELPPPDPFLLGMTIEQRCKAVAREHNLRDAGLAIPYILVSGEFPDHWLKEYAPDLLAPPDSRNRYWLHDFGNDHLEANAPLWRNLFLLALLFADPIKELRGLNLCDHPRQRSPEKSFQRTVIIRNLSDFRETLTSMGIASGRRTCGKKFFHDDLALAQFLGKDALMDEREGLALLDYDAGVPILEACQRRGARLEFLPDAAQTLRRIARKRANKLLKQSADMSPHPCE
jgi:hypothetical protein